ncbi:MAG: restriction endonuclease subunit S [Cyclobacteriaceae bacterium]
MEAVVNTKEACGIPKLRFKEFEIDSKSYKKHSFVDVFSFSCGKNIKQNEASPLFETPCVRYGELYHMYNEVIYKVINRTNLDKSDLRLSHGDEILLPSAGEDPLDIGSASALPFKNVAIGRTINILSPLSDDKYVQNYAAYYINFRLRKKISTLAKGSSISNVYNSDLKKLEIVLPTLPEQQKIASFLTAVDEKIQQLTRKKTLLEQYKKGVMQKLFAQEIRFKDDEGSDYPEWEEKKLGDIGKIRMCKRIFSHETSETGDIPFYKIGTFGKVPDAFISNEQYLNYKEKFSFPKIGDILMSASGTLGRTVIYDGSPAYFQDSNIVWIENNEELTTNSFLYYIYQIVKYDSEGGTIQRLYNNIISSAKFVCPSLQEQQKIAAYLSSLDQKIESVNHQITHTQTFKKGLLQGMFV